jgi:hypothetical protein
MRVLLFATLLLGACGATQHPQASGPVPLDAWCRELGATYCSAIADRCLGGMAGAADGCRDSFLSSCLAGRAPATPSGRDHGELSQCVARVRGLTCEGLGAAMADPAFAAACAAKAPPG